MDFTKIPLIERLTERMGWLGAREKTLAQNIANADTPGYQPRDLKPLDFDAELRKLTPIEPLRTSARHLNGTKPLVDGFDPKKDKETYETAPVGNAVVVEEQMMQVSETQVNHNMMTNLYRKHIDMLKMAIGRGGM
jgi:flagellar basal-body rod protein FlgB